jgi:putative permease
VNDTGRDLYRALTRATLFAAGLVIALWLLFSIRLVLLAALLALILAVALNAPVNWLERRRVSRGLATAIAFFSFVAVTGMLGWLVVPRVAEELPTLIGQMPTLLDSLVDFLVSITGDHPEVQRQLSRVVDWSLTAFEGLWQYAGEVLTLLVIGIFVLALVIYMVVEIRIILKWYVLSMPPRLREQAARAFAHSSRMVIGWIVASVLIGGIKGIAAFIFLTIMGIPGALVWSVVAFFGAFVPRIGFYFSTLPPVLTAFTVDPLLAIWVLLFYVIFSEILGNFIAPRIYAETMDLNAAYVLFMTLAMGYAFGIIGVLIAAPIAGIAKAYYDAFYYDRQPADPELERRIDAMMHRKPEAVGGSPAVATEEARA